MKILWVSNSPIGPAAKILDEAYSGTSGGWIQSEYEALEKSNVEMAFICTSATVKKNEVIHKKNEMGEVYCFKAPRPSTGIKNPEYLVHGITKAIDEIKPDIIQIWGTETCVSNIVSSCAPHIPKIIFIQGLIGVHARYLGGYFDQEQKRYVKHQTPIAFLKEFIRRRTFIRHVDIERQTIQNCRNIIADSHFVKDYCTTVGADIRCFQYPLLPNKLFYNYCWNMDSCRRHSIFTVFGSNSEKGLHQLIKAIAIVKPKYPDVIVNVPGSYPLDQNGKLLPSKNDTYYLALKRLMVKLGVEDNFRFIGRLDAAGMAVAMSSSHVFVNPSCMEVHALSMRECMVQGIPCISAICGGVLDFLRHGENGMLYRYEEYEVLAGTICRLFEDDSLCEKISEQAKIALDSLAVPSTSLNCIYNTLLNATTHEE